MLLADDHAVVRSGLRALLQQRGVDVVAEAWDGASALAAYREHGPELVLLDLTMPPGVDGLEAARQLCAEGARVLVLTMHDDEALRAELLAAGACGYVLKQAPEEELLQAIRAACPSRPSVEAALTPREEQILRLLAAGYGNKEVAGRLDISVKTVETHRAHLMLKLGAQSRADLVAYALRQGWLQGNP